MNRICKTAALSLTLLMALGLCSGCNRNTGEYYTETIHSEKQNVLPVEGEDSGINGYYTLKGAILNMVGLGRGEDVFRVGRYSGDLEADLKLIIQEITTAEPIGIYGVSSITVDQTRVLTYRELSVSIQYKRTAAELRSIMDIRSTYDLQSRMAALLTTMGEVRVFSVGDGIELQENIQKEVYTAWINCGADAPGLDYAAADFYPEGQDKAILEICPQYIDEPEVHQAKAAQIRAKGGEVAETLRRSGRLDEQLEGLADWLMENVVYDYSAQRVVNETGGEQRKGSSYTAYGALVNGEAAQSGFVLAASVVLEQLDVEHEVVTGYVGEDIYSWITLNDGERQILFDVTALQNERTQRIYGSEMPEDLFLPW